MRAWIILFETIISIILLTTVYLMFVNYYRNLNKNQNFFEITLYIEDFRKFIEYCDPNKVYLIYNLSSNEYRICIKGNIGSLEDLSNYSFYKKYLFSGYREYDPFILILYK